MANLRKGVLEKVQHFLTKKKWEYEVIIVDDGSTDGSIEFAEHFIKKDTRFRLIKNPHLGKAGAVTTGMLKAKGQYVLFTDMDQATPIEEIDKLLPFIDKGFDIIIGSRNTQRKGSPWTRGLMSVVWISLRRFVIGLPSISDTNCGFKLFKHDAAQKTFGKLKSFHKGYGKVSGSSVTAGFDVEMLYIAQKLGYKIKEVPVSWLYVETRRVSMLKDSLDGIFDLVAIKKNDWLGKYNEI